MARVVFIHTIPEKMLDLIGFDEMDDQEVPGVSIHEVPACPITDLKAFHEGREVLLFLPHCENLLGKNGISISDMVLNLLP